MFSFDFSPGLLSHFDFVFKYRKDLLWIPLDINYGRKTKAFDFVVDLFQQTFFLALAQGYGEF